MKLITFLLTFLCSSFIQAELKVATLTPLLADLAKQIGGEHVTVIDLMGPNGDPHSFQPSPRSLSEAQGAKIYLASGKKLEPFLPKLRSIVAGKASVIEVGRTIPTLQISADSPVYACCPKHSSGSIDPHWWQSVENWRRASNVVYKAFSEADPANADYYKARAKSYRKELSTLKSWCKKQIATIPKNQRHLATAHAAYGYFCKEFGFKSIPVQGLNKEQSATSQYITEAITTLKDNKVKAIFPEKLSNPKSIQTIAKTANVKIGEPLYADSHSSIIGMFKANVSTIVKTLR